MPVPELLPLFDAHLHPEALSDQDLESMRFFGVERALVVAHHFPEPTASITRLGSSLANTSVGDMEDSGTLPGAIALGSPVTSPYALGTPGRAAKSSISSLSSTPVPLATTHEPNA